MAHTEATASKPAAKATASKAATSETAASKTAASSPMSAAAAVPCKHNGAVCRCNGLDIRCMRGCKLARCKQSKSRCGGRKR